MSDKEYEIERLVTVASYSSPWEAQLAKARLEAGGIEAVIADENFMRLYWAVGSAMGGMKVQVRESAVGTAAELLARAQPIPEIYLVTEEEAAALTGAAAVSRPIPDPPDLVTVARFTTPWEAQLAKTRLAAEGIESCVTEERLPPVSLLTGEPLALNRLEVFETDAEQALGILNGEAWDEDWDEEEEEKPASE